MCNFNPMKLICFLITLFGSISLFSQQFVPGQTYFGQDSLIEYQCGNLPLILSAPHGGYEKPASIPDRNCIGCVTQRDSYTQELTRQLKAEIVFKTGCYPHVIINRLYRGKLDANREIIEATDSNSVTEPYWHEYMNFADSAKKLVYKDYPKGLFIDIHGHGHTIQRLEVGYLLSASDLRKSDSLLNLSPINTKTSVLNLRFSNLNSYTHAELIRGTNSLGSMLQRKGIPSVPSDSIPFPLVGEPYFNGGYNTKRFGSRNGGTMDAIQIESHQSIRFTKSIRDVYADSLSDALLDYLEVHYFQNFSQHYCNIFSSVNELNKYHDIVVFPNPTNGLIELRGIDSKATVSLYSIEGKQIDVKLIGNKINFTPVNSGVYLLKVNSMNTNHTIRIVKD